MADLSDLNSAQNTKLTGQDNSGVETYPIKSYSNNELAVSDIPNQTGVNATLNLTTTAVEGKVGANALVNRKYVEMLALTTNVKWGYDSTCPFELYKSQFFSLPMGENCKVYFKASTGTAQVVVGEK
jgi:hypothetical protein